MLTLGRNARRDILMRRYRRRPVRNKNGWSQIFMKQVIVSIIIVLFVIVLKKMDIAMVDKGMKAVEEALSQNYTMEKAVSVANMGVDKLKSLPDILEYTPPLDQEIEADANKIQVHAIGGGTVSEVGFDEAFGGNYIKILHDKDMESIYGSMENTYAKPLEKVKKGQIIGAIFKEKKETFYFELRADGKVVDSSDYIDF